MAQLHVEPSGGAGPKLEGVGEPLHHRRNCNQKEAWAAGLLIIIDGLSTAGVFALLGLCLSVSISSFPRILSFRSFFRT
jgi:hypothetical protein